MLFLDDSNFRIITDMVRNENGQMNYYAGIDLLSYLFKVMKYKFEVLMFCKDTKKANENIN
jgi:hypothetical protein